MRSLFDPVKIGSIEIKNRLMMTAMGTSYATNDGCCTEQLSDYWEARAKGGWGLIITELCRINAETLGNDMGLFKDEQIPGYKEATDKVHAYGAKIFVQINHKGRRESSAVRLNNMVPLAPSAIAAKPNGDLPHAMSIAEIKKLISEFVEAAVRAKKAGFDGVEIHGAHGWTLSSFLSPISNKRTDEYGGSITNRARIVVEIIKGIKEKAGADFPITIKLSTQEYLAGGLKIEESKAIARILEKAGIDGINCSQGIFLSNYASIPPHHIAPGSFIENAKAIKSVVNVPVMAVGRLNEPEIAETVLAGTNIDVIGMARAALADPEYPNKLKEGRIDEINHCVGCLQGCIQAMTNGDVLRCLVNPVVGRETELKNISKAEKIKKVYIAGGGISGCEAAIVAASRGHYVTIFEKESDLGGQWRAAMTAVGKTEFGSFLMWQKQMLNKLNVEIRMKTELTKEIVQQEQPDAVLVATGGTPIIEVLENNTKINIVSALEIFYGKKIYGKNVVVLGGGLTGAEVADHMAFYGSNVYLIKGRNMEIATEAPANVRHCLLEDMKERNVNVMVGTKLIAIKDNTVVVNKNGEIIELPDIETIVMAKGNVCNNELIEELKGEAKEVIAIGDAQKIKDGYYNIYEGFKAGLTL